MYSSTPNDELYHISWSLQLVHCAACCEPFHTFCIVECEGGNPVLPKDDAPDWICPRCTVCHSCGRGGGVRLSCHRCQRAYHPPCLGGNVANATPNANVGREPERPWMCSACVRCKSCRSLEVTVFVGNLPLCQPCFQLRQKGNYCPLCQGCYDDNDYDAKMMECAQCKNWIHARCEGLSDEKYQVLSFLPESVEYVCRICHPQSSAPWMQTVEAELRAGCLAVLRSLGKSRTSCSLLRRRPSLQQQYQDAESGAVISGSNTIQQLRAKFNIRECAIVVRDCRKKEEEGGRSYESDIFSLSDIKRRVSTGEYGSVYQFHKDMEYLIYSSCREHDPAVSERVSGLYYRILLDVFPWFSPCGSTLKSPSWSGSPSKIIPVNAVKEEPFLSPSKREPSSPSPVKMSRPWYYDNKECAVIDARQCVMCRACGDSGPNECGRLLYSGVNEWVHVNCALWSPEVFEEVDGSLQNVGSALSRGRHIRCASCQGKGASVGCCAKGCQSSFHFMCARSSECVFLEDKFVYCKHHTSMAGDRAVAADVRVDRLVYVEQDRRRRKHVEPNRVRIAVGSLRLETLGEIFPAASDRPDVLVPINLVASRLYWSTSDPFRIVRYEIRTIRSPQEKVDAVPAFISNIPHLTLDHSGDSADVLRQLKQWQVALAEFKPKKEMQLKGGGRRSSSESDSPSVSSPNAKCFQPFPQEEPLPSSIPVEVKQTVSYLIETVCRKAEEELVLEDLNILEDIPEDQELVSLVLNESDFEKEFAGFVNDSGPACSSSSSVVATLNPAGASVHGQQKDCNSNFTRTYIKTEDSPSRGLFEQVRAVLEELLAAVCSPGMSENDKTLPRWQLSGLSLPCKTTFEHLPLRRISRPRPSLRSLRRRRKFLLHGDISSAVVPANGKAHISSSVSKGPCWGKENHHLFLALDGTADSSSGADSPDCDEGEDSSLSALTKRIQEQSRARSAPCRDGPVRCSRCRRTYRTKESFQRHLTDACSREAFTSSDSSDGGEECVDKEEPMVIVAKPESPKSQPPVRLNGCHTTTAIKGPAVSTQLVPVNGTHINIPLSKCTSPLSKPRRLQLVSVQPPRPVPPSPVAVASAPTVIVQQVSSPNLMPAFLDAFHQQTGQTLHYVATIEQTAPPPPPPPPQSTPQLDMVSYVPGVICPPLVLTDTPLMFGSPGDVPVFLGPPQPPQPAFTLLETYQTTVPVMVPTPSPIITQGPVMSSQSIITGSALGGNGFSCLPHGRNILQSSPHHQAQTVAPEHCLKTVPTSSTAMWHNGVPVVTSVCSSLSVVNRKRENVIAPSMRNVKVPVVPQTIIPDKRYIPPIVENKIGVPKVDKPNPVKPIDNVKMDKQLHKCEPGQCAKPGSVKIVLHKKPGDTLYKISDICLGTTQNGRITPPLISRMAEKVDSISQVRALQISAQVSSSTNNMQGSAGVLVVPVNEKEKENNKAMAAKNNHLTDNPIVYEVRSSDGFSYKSGSVGDVWRRVFDAVQDARMSHHLSPLPTSGDNCNKSGLQLLGLTHNALRFLVEQLPGAGACPRYRPRYHAAPRDDLISAEDVLPPPNRSGCARCESYKLRNPSDMFSWLASRHRRPPPMKQMPSDADSVQVNSRRATNVDLPMAMRFRHLRETAREAVGVYRSTIHGRGLFCLRDIDAGEMVIEYAGEVIRSSLTDKREKYYESKEIGCYMFRIDDYTVVDATVRGNAARFINHSCDPNCYSRVVDILGKKHILIFALRKIRLGEELTYDYKFPIEDVKIPCMCGARRCRKYLN